jgi:hypothetical protein
MIASVDYVCGGGMSGLSKVKLLHCLGKRAERERRQNLWQGLLTTFTSPAQNFGEVSF